MAQTDTFEDQIAALEATFTGATDVAATFEGELSRLRESMVYTGREVDQLASGLGRGLGPTFKAHLVYRVRLRGHRQGGEPAQQVPRS